MDNIQVRDGSGNSKDLAAREIDDVLYPKHIISDAAGDDLIGQKVKAASLPTTLASNDDIHTTLGKYTTIKGYEQISVLSAAVGFTTPLPSGATMALVIPEGQDVRWRDDGVAPTANIGMPLAFGQPWIFQASQLAAVQFIEVTAGAKLNVSYYS